MRTVEALRAVLRLAEQAGYEVRHEWLDGAGGGACEVKGRKLLVLDLALGPQEQLQIVLDALHRDPEVNRHELRRFAGLGTRREVA